MSKISVVIITLNEEKNIDRCLRSLKDVADEILIVDSNSNDNTVKIAERYGAKVVLQSFMGYKEQKNFATKHASNDWILSLDADEALSPELRQNIMKQKADLKHDAYWFARLTYYCGKWIRHSGWYPDKKIRLYNRTKGQWEGEKVHEYWQPRNEANTGELEGDLLHYSFYTLSDHILQINKFTELSAKENVEKGKNYSLATVMITPVWSFFVNYFFRMGFLDGHKGYLVCKLSAYATFLKYIKTRQYSKQQIAATS